MPFTYDHLRRYPIPEVEHTIGERECILYALSVGFGEDPVDPGQLAYVYESGLRAVPTMANVLAYPGFWLKREDTGADWKRVLHGEQAITLHRPLPIEGALVGRSRVAGIDDKGPEKGAVVYVERTVADAATGEPVCTVLQTSICRGDGGCGGSDPPPHPRHALPEREPDGTRDLAIPAQAALLYRLNGDANPLHADPEVARAAGFDRPVLHGMCTMGFACHAVLGTVCDYDADRVRSMAVRFTAPVYPGDTLHTEIWVDGAMVSFRSRVRDRDATVLANGLLELAG